MSFRFKVHRAVTIAGIITLDGVLERGTLGHGVAAIAQTREGSFSVVMMTVAFVDPPDLGSGMFTLTIAEPEFSISLLNGATLTSDVDAT